MGVPIDDDLRQAMRRWTEERELPLKRQVGAIDFSEMGKNFELLKQITVSQTWVALDQHLGNVPRTVKLMLFPFLLFEIYAMKLLGRFYEKPFLSIFLAASNLYLGFSFVQSGQSTLYSPLPAVFASALSQLSSTSFFFISTGLYLGFLLLLGIVMSKVIFPACLSCGQRLGLSEAMPFGFANRMLLVLLFLFIIVEFGRIGIVGILSAVLIYSSVGLLMSFLLFSKRFKKYVFAAYLTDYYYKVGKGLRAQSVALVMHEYGGPEAYKYSFGGLYVFLWFYFMPTIFMLDAVAIIVWLSDLLSFIIANIPLAFA